MLATSDVDFTVGVQPGCVQPLLLLETISFDEKVSCPLLLQVRMIKSSLLRWMNDMSNVLDERMSTNFLHFIFFFDVVLFSQVWALKDLMEPQSVVHDVDTFPGPAATTPAKKLKEYVEARAAGEGETENEESGKRLLWTVASLALKFKV